MRKLHMINTKSKNGKLYCKKFCSFNNDLFIIYRYLLLFIYIYFCSIYFLKATNYLSFILMVINQTLIRDKTIKIITITKKISKELFHRIISITCSAE